MITRVLVLSVLVTATALAQQAPSRSELDPTQFGLVYDVPATKDVRLENVPYFTSGARVLTLDVYTLPREKGPRARDGAPLPAVVFLNTIGDRLPDKVKDWGIYRSWPRLVGALGMAGISMECDGEHVDECLTALFAFLEREGAAHGVDGARLGVYAASANVGAASRYLNRATAPRNVCCAAYFYGWPDVDVPRRDLPVLCIGAESDLPDSRELLGALWQRVLASGAPWTFEVATGLPHAFDAFADNDASRRTIQRALAYWKSFLEPVPAPPWQPSKARAILAAQYGHDSLRIVQLFGEWLAAHPDDPDAHAARGLALCQLRRGNEARPDLEKALALGSQDPGVHGCLGMVLASEGKYAPAVEHMQRAIEGHWVGSELYGQLGFAQLSLGQNAEAVRSYEESLRLGIPPGARTLGAANYNLACGYARLGRIPDALAAIERAVEQGFGTRASYEGDADLAPLRDEERFLMALDRLGPAR